MSDLVWIVVVIGLLASLVIVMRFVLRDHDGERSVALGVEREVPTIEGPVHQLRYPTEWEATAAVARLEHAGIRAVASGGAASGYRAEAPGFVSVLISEDDRERAEALLAQPEEIDWDAVDVGEREDPDDEPPCCPHCGYDLRGAVRRACSECGGRLDQ